MLNDSLKPRMLFHGDFSGVTPQLIYGPDELPQDLIIKSDAIVVSIDRQGAYRINQDAVTFDQLGTRLFDIYSARANKNMFILGDVDLAFDDVVKVIDIAKGAGVGDIGLLTPEDRPGG